VLNHVTYWVAFTVPDVYSVYLDDDDLENDEVIPELQSFFDEVAALVRRRGWVLHDSGHGGYDDRPPELDE
jgi:hypothetical protein